MKKIIINGKFLSDRMQGIVRYAREMVKALDNILDEKNNVILLAPPNSNDIPELRKINVEIYGKHKGLLWEQTDLRKYLKKNKTAVCVNLCNIAPLFVQPGITTIHDIMYKVNPDHYTTFRNKLSRYWHMFQYRYISLHEKIILTDSEYSKNEIEKYYPASKGKISIISCAWQHVLEYKSSDDWQDRYPFLKTKEYFFSLSTLAKNKNGKWIIEAARHNTDSVFAIAGKYYETEKIDIPSNVHFLGFISDEDACALIKNCRAFIHPSLYEGFGLPPLEALALGADVISSDVTSLPEVLGNSVHYISPNSVDVNLEKLLCEPLEQREKILEKYSWEMSSIKLLNIIKKY